MRPSVARAELLTTVRELGSSVAALDPRTGEDDPPRLVAIADDLQLLLEQAIDTLGVLRDLEDEPSAPELVLDFGEGDSDVEEGSSHRAPVLSPPRLANICFAGIFELGRVLRELASARTRLGALVAAETARRKLLRVFRAVLDAADDVAEPEPAWRREVSDLRSGLVVRRLYADFRRSLRRPDGEDTDAVLHCVRYAAGALATLVTAPAYAEARASDRALLRRLHGRALGWARSDRSVEGGLQLLDDVWTSADLLRDINRRQELRAHDATAIRAALRGPADAPTSWRSVLDSLVGLDDQLDGLILRAARPEDLGNVADEIVGRLLQLR
ncbi:MAG: hypothetical protein JNK45_16250 [Myxococcales bacterium]|nr:hypothetical protein [Myxococcales bacterium]